MIRADNIQFDAAEHVYRRPDGSVVPGVTGILRATGISTDFEALKGMGSTQREAIDRKRDIGSALHADAHAFDDGDIVWATVHPDVLPYLEAWRQFREDKRIEPIARERLVYHHALGYAGTMDGIFRTPSGKTVLIDIKTGDPDDSGCQFQTAAYQLAYQLESTADIHERWGVRLVPDMAGCPYRVSAYADWSDFDRWKAIVTTFYLQPAQRRAA